MKGINLNKNNHKLSMLGIRIWLHKSQLKFNWHLLGHRILVIHVLETLVFYLSYWLGYASCTWSRLLV